MQGETMDKVNHKAKNKRDVPRTFSIAVDKERHVLLCDGKPLHTPGGAVYALPTVGLADAIAKEWRVQEEGEKFDPSAMPLTQLAATALDHIVGKREQSLRMLVAYSATELLCHRADFPLSLAKRQQEIWQPILDWCAVRFGALFAVGAGIMPIAQTPACVTAIEKAVERYDDYQLAGLRFAVDTSGSLALGLAMVEKFRVPAEIAQAAELEALFQAENWGEDPVTTARLESVSRDLEICGQWFELLGG